ncbi:MAG TPA: bifunctional hydroxymethylpyrimidine kinase/phosphomethylpyrimidine kinase [Wenzhouxiangellaceae bacterium]|nr:bifunctional hydroxymethylpyrimidine kinase/phosphomethylpyrimidine kinase [Wenzhouxiangellaceae bacterium]
MEDVAEKQQGDNAPAVALTIAGSDSCGGAGIQADLKTFAALGVFGASAVTAVTAQNTGKVGGVSVMDAGFVAGQIAACFEDLPIGAIKTGMLANAEITRAVVAALRRPRIAPEPRLPLIVDPVMIATSGASLLNDRAVATLWDELLPLAALVTPNLPEAAALTGRPQDADPETLAALLLESGVGAVLIKGGHSKEETCRDLLATPDVVHAFDWPRASGDYHGTGCAYSAAIAAFCARGLSLDTAVSKAGVWLQHQIRNAFRPLHGSLGILPFTPENCRPPY